MSSLFRGTRALLRLPGNPTPWKDPIALQVAQILKEGLALRRTAKSNETIEVECRFGIITYVRRVRNVALSRELRLKMPTTTPLVLVPDATHFESQVSLWELSRIRKGVSNVRPVPSTSHRAIVRLPGTSIRAEYVLKTMTPTSTSSTSSTIIDNSSSSSSSSPTTIAHGLLIGATMKEKVSVTDISFPTSNFDARLAVSREVSIPLQVAAAEAEEAAAAAAAAKSSRSTDATGSEDSAWNMSRIRSRKSVRWSRYLRIEMAAVMAVKNTQPFPALLPNTLEIPLVTTNEERGSVEVEVDMTALLQDSRRSRYDDAVVEEAALELLTAMKYFDSLAS